MEENKISMEESTYSQAVNEFQIIEDPTPVDIDKELTFLANTMARLENLVAGYRKELAVRETTMKRTKAISVIKHRQESPAEYRAAQIELDPDYNTAKDKYQEVFNTLTIAQGRLAGYNAQFVAVRKQAELKKMEMMQLGGQP